MYETISVVTVLARVLVTTQSLPNASPATELEAAGKSKHRIMYGPIQRCETGVSFPRSGSRSAFDGQLRLSSGRFFSSGFQVVSFQPN